MNPAIWPGKATFLSLLPLASVTAEATGAGLDIAPCTGKALALLDVSAPVAGTDPTLDVVLQTSPEASKVTSVTYAGHGTGRIEVEAGPDPVAETITFTASSATSFAVEGTVSGPIGTLTVGIRFTSPQINALIHVGATAFQAADLFTVPTTARTWTEVAAFEGVTSAAAREKKVLDLDQSHRYLRAVASIGGTDSPQYLVSLSLLAEVG